MEIFISALMLKNDIMRTKGGSVLDMNQPVYSLSGWGSTPGESHPSDIYGQPYKLRQASLPLVEDSTCRQIYQEGADFEIQVKM